MNCIKCPISEECRVEKMTMMEENLGGASVATQVRPRHPDDCLLVKVLIKVEELHLAELERNKGGS